MASADLSDANAEGAIFQDCHLSKARFDGANLRDCNLSNAKLKGASFSGALLDGVNLTNAVISKESLDPIYARSLDLSSIRSASEDEINDHDDELKQKNRSVSNVN